ncbi:phage holin family protein [Streptomyces sp. NPDC002564]|uniref:phage holin family protein n=1 Tax=Streptomyces sp. NPDC002564 TaxID=3364649 RepID=UPI0036BB6A85
MTGPEKTPTGLDAGLTDELVRTLRAELREELREQTRKQRRTATLYAASGTAALYAGAALALGLGLVIALGLPGWAAALIMAAVLGVTAFLLRNAARPKPARDAGDTTVPGAGALPEPGGAVPAPPVAPPGGLDAPAPPPMPPTVPAPKSPRAER